MESPKKHLLIRFFGRLGLCFLSFYLLDLNVSTYSNPTCLLARFHERDFRSFPGKSQPATWNHAMFFFEKLHSQEIEGNSNSIVIVVLFNQKYTRVIKLQYFISFEILVW